MKLRDEYAANHTWQSAAEQDEAEKAFNNNRWTIWRKSTGHVGGPRPMGRGGSSNKGSRPVIRQPQPLAQPLFYNDGSGWNYTKFLGYPQRGQMHKRGRY